LEANEAMLILVSGDRFNNQKTTAKLIKRNACKKIFRFIFKVFEPSSAGGRPNLR
jgi:hypothetical protein